MNITQPVMAIIILCGLSLLLAWIMVYEERKENHIATYLSKTAASICFVAAAFFATAFSGGSRTLTLLMLGGLVLGMLGDIFLCRVHIAREEYWDILLSAGGLFFLSGHLCYFFAFMSMGGVRNLAVYILVPILVILVFYLMKTQKWKIPRKSWLSYMGYGLVSGLMLSGGIEIFLEKPLPEEMILAAAALVFVLSDITLATWNYGRYHTTWMRYTCISLYYMAQILFVFGIWMN